MRIISLILFFILCACKTERTEYRNIPAWHLAMGKKMPKNSDSTVDTKIIYSPIGGTNSIAVQNYLTTIELEKKDEVTGEITLRAILPEQILSQTLVCLRDRKWDILYEQLLSKNAQDYFKAIDLDLIHYKSYFEKNRLEIAKTIRKMLQSKSFGDKER